MYPWIKPLRELLVANERLDEYCALLESSTFSLEHKQVPNIINSFWWDNSADTVGNSWRSINDEWIVTCKSLGYSRDEVSWNKSDRIAFIKELRINKNQIALRYIKQTRSLL
jgi:hypothetical protein